MTQNQHEMIQSAARDFEAADKKLNTVYAALVKRLKNAPKRVAQLKTSQKLWLQFRDAEAIFVALENEGGSNYPLQLYMSKANTTTQRVIDLEAYLKDLNDR